MALNYLTAGRLRALVEALTPRFLGRDQDHLIKLADETAGAAYDLAYANDQPLYQFRSEILSPAGANEVGINDAGGYYVGATVEAALQEIGADLATAGSGTVTSVNVNNATGITFTGGPITTSGALTPALSANLQAWHALAPSAKQDASANLTSWSAIAPATKADDSGVVHIAGTETITGAKTFSNAAFTWSANAARLQADFSNGTASNRASFQSSTVNGPTILNVLPNGTSNTAVTRLFSSSGLTNYHSFSMQVDATQCYLNSANVGTGTLRPIMFAMNGVIVATISTGGDFTAANIQSTGTVAGLQFQDRTGASMWQLYCSSNSARIYSGAADVFTVDSTGIATAGGIELGYRDIPRTTSALTRGYMFATAAGLTVNTGSAAGSTYSVYNDSASAVTLTQGGGMTLRLAGTATTGNRTLAARGFATIWFNSTTEAIVSGNVT